MSFFFGKSYYYDSLVDFLRFIIPGESKVLVAGDKAGRIGESLPGQSVTAIDLASDRPLDLPAPPEGGFDHVVLLNALGFTDDIGAFFRDLRRVCSPDARVIVLAHNYVWTPVLNLAARWGWKDAAGSHNLLSPSDIAVYMDAAGFERISLHRSLMVPFRLGGLGPLVNGLLHCIPLVKHLYLNHFSVFRLVPECAGEPTDSLTICLTARNERDNIEPLVQGIPQAAPEQEILFVEGHSSDGTREEIERVARAYPEKNVRVIGQPGKGQGDAIREGFSKAVGDVIILLECDMTSPPEDIVSVYQSLARRHSEFVEGSRFVYPMSTESMPLVNQLGNWFFGFVFTMIFKRQMTDVLSGIKGIRKKHFEQVLECWGSWWIVDPFGDFELLFGAVRRGLKCTEIPIHYRPRFYGQTKTRVVGHGWILFKMALVAFVKFRR